MSLSTVIGNQCSVAATSAIAVPVRFMELSFMLFPPHGNKFNGIAACDAHARAVRLAAGRTADARGHGFGGNGTALEARDFATDGHGGVGVGRARCNGRTQEALTRCGRREFVRSARPGPRSRQVLDRARGRASTAELCGGGTCRTSRNLPTSSRN